MSLGGYRRRDFIVMRGGGGDMNLGRRLGVDSTMGIIRQQGSRTLCNWTIHCLIIRWMMRHRLSRLFLGIG